MTTPAPPAADATSTRIPRTVWILGFVSLLMDVSSEMIQTLLPLYLVSGLGVSAVVVGLIEGLSVAIAMGTKMFAGVLSDRIGNRKHLVVLGYGLGAMSKPFFPLADSAITIMGAKFIDRVGKGIRGAPRDALIADVTPPHLRGRSFGLRKSLDTVGGFVGPLMAIGLMLVTGDHFQTVFWVATIPAVLAVVLLVVGIREPEAPPAASKKKAGLRWRDAWRLDTAVWVAIGISVLVTLARFSEAFLLLRAQGVGFSLAWIPLILVFMHLIYGGLAYPVGVLADRVGRIGLLVVSLALLLAANLVLAQADDVRTLLVGVGLWGAHMGFSQGLLATLIADTAAPESRGTAFGLLSLATGVAVLLGNLLAGILWEWQGPAATFHASAVISVLAMAALGVLTMRQRRPRT
jgi:MFS family permease